MARSRRIHEDAQQCTTYVAQRIGSQLRMGSRRLWRFLAKRISVVLVQYDSVHDSGNFWRKLWWHFTTLGPNWKQYASHERRNIRYVSRSIFGYFNVGFGSLYSRLLKFVKFGMKTTNVTLVKVPFCVDTLNLLLLGLSLERLVPMTKGRHPKHGHEIHSEIKVDAFRVNVFSRLIQTLGGLLWGMLQGESMGHTIRVVCNVFTARALGTRRLCRSAPGGMHIGIHLIHLWQESWIVRPQFKDWHQTGDLSWQACRRMHVPDQSLKSWAESFV